MDLGKVGKDYKIIVRNMKNVVFKAKPFFFLSKDIAFFLESLEKMSL